MHEYVYMVQARFGAELNQAELSELVKVFPGNGTQDAGHTEITTAQGTPIFFGLFDDGFDGFVAGTAKPHFDQHIRDVLGFKPWLSEKLQDAEVVGGNAVADVESTNL